jgi:hypothetical protein
VGTIRPPPEATQRFQQRQIRLTSTVLLDTLTTANPHWGCGCRLCDKGIHQRRLTNPSLAGDAHHLPFTLARPRPTLVQLRQLGLSRHHERWRCHGQSRC